MGLNFSKESVPEIPQGSVFWINFDVMATALPDARASAAWMSEWSFKPGQGDDLFQDPPEFFPTLNLVTFRDVVAREAEDAFEDPVVVGRARLLVTVK